MPKHATIRKDREAGREWVKAQRERVAELRAFRDDYGLVNEQVAALLSVPPHRVEAWLLGPEDWPRGLELRARTVDRLRILADMASLFATGEELSEARQTAAYDAALAYYDRAKRAKPDFRHGDPAPSTPWPPPPLSRAELYETFQWLMGGYSPGYATKEEKKADLLAWLAGQLRYAE